jgi:hypothetical protein
MPSIGKPQAPDIVAGNILRGAREESGADRALKALVDYAGLDADLSIGESPKGSNKGPMLAKYFKADDYDPAGAGDDGYPWCAAAVCEWVQSWLKGCPEARRLFGHITPPRTARAFGLHEWAQGPARGTIEIIPQSALTSGKSKILPGDVIVYDFSHCGIACAASKQSLFSAVEGNTDKGGSREGWQVARRPRGFSSVRVALRFIPKGIPA